MSEEDLGGAVNFVGGKVISLDERRRAKEKEKRMEAVDRLLERARKLPGNEDED